jgi:proteasome lid subunit RPN8/RPN11
MITVSLTDQFREREFSRGLARALALQLHRSTRKVAEPLPQLFETLAPSYELSLGRGAHLAIRDEIRTNGKFIETGGWLFSDPRRHDHVLVATRPGADIGQSPSSLMLGFEQLEAVQRECPHLALRGDWHLHPTGDPVPSERDLRGWASGAKLTGDYWAGIIVAPARTMWDEPELFGWISTESFCERLALEEF